MPRVFLLLPLLLLLVAPLQAQTGAVPRDGEAELVFDQAIGSFEEGDYGMAYRRFRLVYTQFPLNQKTTAALIMAGKSLYRQGDFERAEALLSEFVRAYPSSRYVAEARRILGYMGDRPTSTRRETVTLGIALPLTSRDTPLTQAFFNGLRLAVDEHNATGQGPQVRMVFRDTENDAGAARNAVNALRESAVIVGPLYSDEALSAAAAAEAARVPLVAPLATDPRVSAGRQYVFQANATTEVRGRVMARYALENMRMRRFGVVSASGGDGVSAQMAEGFQDEIQREGGIVGFVTEIGARGWARLDESLDAAALAEIDAIYLPVAGGSAQSDVRGALAALERTGATPRVLGNAEWHQRPNADAASRYGVTYTNDFYLDEGSAAVQRFREQYRAQSGKNLAQAPFVEQRLAFTGYDLGRFLLASLGQNRPLPDAMRRAGRFDGLGINLDFRNGQVNDALYLFRYRAGQAERLR